MKNALGPIGKLLTLLVLLSSGIGFWANKKRNILPDESQLLASIESQPQQTEYQDRAFTLDWREQQYVLYPVAEYEITGLVVTRNDIGGFSDIYHTRDSVDVLDVCLIWGDNATEEVYRNLEFWSEPFSCWFRPKNEIGQRSFRDDELSNTHVIAKDEDLAERLNTIRLGDQIRMRGKLVNYHPAGASEQLRSSSLVRTDRGNGACEVMYVEGFEVLERGNPGWNKLFDLCRLVLIWSIVLKVISVLLFPYLEYRWS